MSNTFDPFNAEPIDMFSEPAQRTAAPSDGARHIDDVTAERLLNGSGDGALHALLSAARAPGSAPELAGEEAALAAFRSAGHAATLGMGAAVVRSHASRARSTRRPGLRRLLTVKVAAIAAAALVGGVAVAATTGMLPFGPGSVPSSTATTLLPTSAPGSSQPFGSGEPTTTAGALPGSSGKGPAAAALLGLCRAYLAHVTAHPGKPWDNSGFATLSAAAGGDARVGDFCTQLVDAAEKSKSPSRPSSTGDPSGSHAATPGSEATPGTQATPGRATSGSEGITHDPIAVHG